MELKYGRRCSMTKCVPAVLAMLAGLAAGHPALAQQDWPAKPVRFIAGSTPGSVGDVVLRIIGDQFQKQTGQPWIIDYRPGAGSSIAAVAASKAAPDGYTYGLVNTGVLRITPYVFVKPPYDALKDFTFVARLVSLDSVLWVRKDSPFRSVRELVDFAKANPGKLNYASTGSGSVSHLGAVLLASKAGIDVVHVPYKSTAATAAALLSGESDFAFESLGTAIGQIKAGAARALGVPGPSRLRALPDVPTLSEAGVPDIELTSYFIAVAPVGTPPPIVARMSAVIKEALSDPATIKRLEELTFGPAYVGPDELKALAEAEVRRWGPIIESAGVPKQ
jgi:tripartite-type tricarboxylate transporter receptor subunit TctC